MYTYIHININMLSLLCATTQADELANICIYYVCMCRVNINYTHTHKYVINDS